MSKQFFTKHKLEDKEFFLPKKEAKKFSCIQDLIKAGKEVSFRCDGDDCIRTSLYPFTVELDFRINEWYTNEEKKRMRINIKGKTVNLIGLYSEINCVSYYDENKNRPPIFTPKNRLNKYTSCAVSDFLVGQKICKAQRGHFKSLYYNISDKKLFDFFESRGYKKEFLNPNQPDRVSFTKTVKNEEEANQNYDDIYDFDRMYSPTRNRTRKVLFEKQISGLTKF